MLLEVRVYLEKFCTYKLIYLENGPGCVYKNIRTIMISFVTFRILKLVLNKNWKDNIPFVMSLRIADFMNY